MDSQTDQTPKKQLVERLKSSTNILVTVSTDPSVDQLAACIGLTLWLNKLGKHATAVFSGEVPSTLEFLQPESTLEKNTDSLRDFIISLDKSKADKLRYKVEDRVVKIFITPYRTNLTADDLEFSQGDFNVDTVLALGVHEQQDLDNAITGHGRILHDATVMSINTAGKGGVGSINWQDPSASSLCELAVDIGRELGQDQLDNQIATALLTGIVAETDRFSNEKTTPQTMSVSAELMSAGANQQLVASKLEGTSVPLRDSTTTDATTTKAPDNGTLEIGHKRDTKQPEASDSSDDNSNYEEKNDSEPLPMDSEPAPVNDAAKTHIQNANKASRLITEPPTLGGTLTANTTPDRPEQEPLTDPLSLPKVEDSRPLLSHDEPTGATSNEPSDPGTFAPPPPHWNPPAFLDNASPEPAEPPVSVPQPAPTTNIESPQPVTTSEMPGAPAPEATDTLTELEHSIESPHAEESTNPNLDVTKLDSARSEVESALNSAPAPAPPEPVEALNAQPIPLDTPQQTPPAPQSLEFDPAAFGIADADTAAPAPQPLVIPGATEQPSVTQSVPMPTDPSAAPPVPPPLPPSMYQPDANANQDPTA